MSTGTGSSGLLNVARKEFTDHLTSKKFLLLLSLFLIICLAGVYQGVVEYQKAVDNYAEMLQFIPADEWSKYGMAVEQPSVVAFLLPMASYLSTIGAILAIAMGFDLISRERETHSLKTLLTAPIFRDQIINGKALGGIAAIVFAVVISMVISLGTLLFLSIVPTLEEVVYIIMFAIVAVLFLLTYFSISLFFSTLSKTSGGALVAALVVFALITYIAPIGMSWATDAMVGEFPEYPEILYSAYMHPVEVIDDGSEGTPYGIGTDEYSASAGKSEYLAVLDEYNREVESYYARLGAVTDTFTVISPTDNFLLTSMYLASPSLATGEESSVLSAESLMWLYSSPMLVSSLSYTTTTMSDEDMPGLEELLAKIWVNIVSLLAFPVIFFGAAYLFFMRMDVR